MENKEKVTLFTHPRRFGKTLNMSMLKHFLEIEGDSTLFDGLQISKERKLCEEYMGKFTMSDELLMDSILTLSQFLERHYRRKAVILIDEYDVPLDKAYRSGYYEAMVKLIRIMFGQALKTNESLQFAVLTGCLRISKESIFTGLNNFTVYAVQDVHYTEYFGFTDGEVRCLLENYGLEDRYNAIEEWYDGYRFGKLDVYCPWVVINYCHALKMGGVIEPQNYWANSSGNDIVRQFIGRANSTIRNEIEVLVGGGGITKKIRRELTYRDLDSRVDNLWSVLYTTGYLTRKGEANGDMMELVIPNKEIRTIFVEQIQEWFEDESGKDGRKLDKFCRAFLENNVAVIEEEFTSYLKKTISIRDTNVKKEMKENLPAGKATAKGLKRPNSSVCFYHGILLGIFGHMDQWRVKSNAEAGDGYGDIVVEIDDGDVGIIIELKYAENARFEAACKEAMEQIKARNYEELLLDDGMKTIYRYGIACYKRRCKVVSE